MDTYKISLIGEGGVGKTTFVKRHLKNVFEKKYVATLGVEVHPLRFDTTVGPVCFNMWDCAGQEKFGGLRDGYFVQSHACIVMFDKTSKYTMKNVAKWLLLFSNTFGVGITPIVICGTKSDCADVRVSNEDITQMVVTLRNIFPRLAYFDISSKIGQGIDGPLLWILKQKKVDEMKNIEFLK